LTFSVPLTGIPQTVPEYVTTTVLASVPGVALPFVNVNGQFTPPCDTRPLALQLIAEPDRVPAPDPVTVMLLAQVAVNDTLAALVVVGVTVYLRLPHPVAGVLAVTDCQVPANASMETVGVPGVGLVGVVVLVLLENMSQPAVMAQARTNATARLVQDFMFFLIVTYDFLL
jgi:hypothetical protein